MQEIKCPKCNSANIKKTGPFAREIKEGMPPQNQGDQMVNYYCNDCHNSWEIKFGEDDN